jgi:hypothetical protein
MNSQELAVLHLEDGSLPAHSLADISSSLYGDVVKSIAIAGNVAVLFCSKRRLLGGRKQLNNRQTCRQAYRKG